MPIIGGQFQLQDPFAQAYNSAAQYMGDYQKQKQANAQAQQDAIDKQNASDLAQSNLDRTYNLDTKKEQDTYDNEQNKNNETNRHNKTTEGTAQGELQIKKDDAKTKQEEAKAKIAADYALAAYRKIQAKVEAGKMSLQEAERQQHLAEARLAGVRADLLPAETQAKINEAQARTADSIAAAGEHGAKTQEINLESNNLRSGKTAQGGLNKPKSDNKNKPETATQEATAADKKAKLAEAQAVNLGYAKKDLVTGAITWNDNLPPAGQKLKASYDNGSRQAINLQNQIASGNNTISQNNNQQQSSKKEVKEYNHNGNIIRQGTKLPNGDIVNHIYSDGSYD